MKFNDVHDNSEPYLKIWVKNLIITWTTIVRDAGVDIWKFDKE